MILREQRSNRATPSTIGAFLRANEARISGAMVVWLVPAATRRYQPCEAENSTVVSGARGCTCDSGFEQRRILHGWPRPRAGRSSSDSPRGGSTMRKISRDLDIHRTTVDDCRRREGVKQPGQPVMTEPDLRWPNSTRLGTSPPSAHRTTVDDAIRPPDSHVANLNRTPRRPARSTSTSGLGRGGSVLRKAPTAGDSWITAAERHGADPATIGYHLKNRGGRRGRAV